MLRQPIVCVLGHVDHGKCVEENTLVWLADGRLRPARELFEEYEPKGARIEMEDGFAVELRERPKLLSFDGERMISAEATHVWKKKAKELVEVRLTNGDCVKTTPEHPFLVFSDFNLKYARADELKKGDVVAGPSSIALDCGFDW
ncbi:MAG: hypothetical protein V1834_02765, partial [Candidatus Micrarchaeota archaeon]